MACPIPPRTSPPSCAGVPPIRVPIVPAGVATPACPAPVCRTVPGRALLLSLTRLNRVREVDAEQHNDRGRACILQNLQDVARDANRLFPLSLGAEGSCTIGGNLSTNAGGVAVLRYGNARNSVSGLKWLLPMAGIWNGLRGLHKDNTG